jgi:hypothetical protein
VVLSKELLARLRAGVGDTLYMTEAPNGIRITAGCAMKGCWNRCRRGRATAGNTTRTFLALNAVEIAFEAGDAIATVQALAFGELSEEELADWFRGQLASG